MKLSLKKNPHFSGRKGPLLLIIMDGVGLGNNDDSDAVHLAKTPVLDQILQTPLYTQLKTHGSSVGLPNLNDMGNSEVGHNALGAGRIFDQGAKLVNQSIVSGKLFQTESWKKIILRGKSGGTVHFIGLLSDGNVHSHIDHLFSLINRCVEEGIKHLRLHTLLDGRDVSQRSALSYLESTESLLQKISQEKALDYQIASGGGRMLVTMDRYEADWNIVKKGWDAHVHGIGKPFPSASQAVETFYQEDEKVIDQYLDSFVVMDPKGKPVGKIKDGDSVAFFNFRGDRAIEISRAFEEDSFSYFDRGKKPDVFFAGMLLYDGDLQVPKNYLVDPPFIDQTISEYLCAEKITSFAISETQKYGHVTYFWNGNRSGYIDKELETYVEIPSDKIPFDQAPKMKAFEITEKTINLLKKGDSRFGRINFPNGDMVGHTGIMEATIKAVETVDECVGKLIKVVESLNGISIVTADHGNADEMFVMKNGKKLIKTSHTLNLVPFAILDSGYEKEYKMGNMKNPGLANVAATILNLLGFEKPDPYDPSLLLF